MTKDQIIKDFANQYGYTQSESREIVQQVLEYVSDKLRAGKELDIYGFGKFWTRNVDGYTGKNPKTGEKVKVEGFRQVRFKPGASLKKLVKEG